MDKSRSNGLPARLLRELESLDKPGSFCSSGVVPAAVNPVIDVKGLGVIGLPLPHDQAKKLAAKCQRAPYGKGEETILDSKVRQGLKLDSSSFTISNPAWRQTLDLIMTRVQEDLGLEGAKLVPRLYDLLLYEKGGFFLPHRDGERMAGMVATLVVVLPSAFSGGELMVRHEGEEVVVDFAASDPRMCTQFAAFYADCEHEVKPLKEGYRLCLIYNLVLAGGRSKKVAEPPKRQDAVKALASLLSSWDSTPAVPSKLAFTLQHYYTERGLSWDELKGLDRTRARALAEAAEASGCHAHLALVTLWESGSTTESYDDHPSGSSSGDRWGALHISKTYGEDDVPEEVELDEGNEEEDDWEADSSVIEIDDEDEEEEEEDEEGVDDCPYEMEELFDSSLTADHWIAASGQMMSFGKIEIEEDEVLPPNALQGVAVSQHVHGYIGNEGLTLDRWYRRAAVVVWPDARHYEVLCGAGPQAALASLAESIKAAKRASKVEAPAHWERCRKFLAAILANWEPAYRFYDGWGRSSGEDALSPAVSEALHALDDPALYRTFLTSVLHKDSSVAVDQRTCKALLHHGLQSFRGALSSRSFSDADEFCHVQRNVEFLRTLCEQIPAAGGKARTDAAREVCTQFAEALIRSWALSDQKATSYIPTYREPSDADDWAEWARSLEPVKSAVASMLVSLAVLDANSALQTFFAHLDSYAPRYPFQSVRVKALVEAAKSADSKQIALPAALREWSDSVRRKLESFTAAEPKPPADMTREATVKCSCADCKELNHFLKDPLASQHRFQRVQADRLHLEGHIRSYRCDLGCMTEKRPRPQILVCTKNTASYERRLRTYRGNLALLEQVRKLIDGTASTRH